MSTRLVPALIAYHAATGGQAPSHATLRRLDTLLKSGWHPQDAARYLVR